VFGLNISLVFCENIPIQGYYIHRTIFEIG
jgi:hypothetical protein